jgi:hypothetical protein
VKEGKRWKNTYRTSYAPCQALFPGPWQASSFSLTSNFIHDKWTFCSKFYSNARPKTYWKSKWKGGKKRKVED